jgi:hypothetical protein
MLVKPPPPVRSHFFAPAPDVRLDYERTREFERLYGVAQQQEPGRLLDYNCPFPKYEFLYYLTRHKRVVLHGSSQAGIEVFKPLHAPQTSNLIAVYATADELWAIFSAVKSGNELTINGFFWATDDHGKARKLYDFAFNPGAPGGTEWVTGVVYALPQSAFETWGHDWVSKSAVRPQLCLPVVPEDIPFLTTLSRVTDRRAGEASFRILASDHLPNHSLPSLTP